MLAILNDQHKKYLFFIWLLEKVNTKNKSYFLCWSS
jgi:hypothetical protein